MKLTSQHIRTVADPCYGVMPLYTKVCDEIDSALGEVRASTESIANTLLGRAIVSVCDTFTGLLNTFVSNITRCFKNLKRSELKEFCQSNRAKVSVACSAINKDQTTVAKMSALKVDMPAGLKVSMPQAVEGLETIYKQLNAVETAKAMQVALQEIFALISKGDKSVTQRITVTSSYIWSIIRAVKPVILKCQTDFGSDRGDSVPFNQAYPKPGDVKLSIDKLVAMENRLNDVFKLSDMASQMESVVRGIVDLIKDKDNLLVPLTSKNVVELGETAKNLALVFDSYSLAATRQMTLEHNTVLNINTLYKAIYTQS